MAGKDGKGNHEGKENQEEIMQCMHVKCEYTLMLKNHRDVSLQILEPVSVFRQTSQRNNGVCERRLLVTISLSEHCNRKG